MSADEKVFLVNVQGAEPTVKALNLPEGGVRSVSLRNTGISLVTGDQKLLTSKIKDGSLEDWKQPGQFTRFGLIQIKSGLSHDVAITTDNNLVSWGKNNQGQLGRGDICSKRRKRKDVIFPVSLVPFSQEIRICAVSCGNAHTLCLSDNGQVYSWGSNDCKQLGLGNTSTLLCTKPRLVQDLAHVPIAQISAGGQHSFALSVTGDTFSWGSNRFGQLGFENKPSTRCESECPRLVSQKAKSVSCGGNHTAILAMDGQVYTCGLGSSGQLGHHPNTENQFNPRKIEELENMSVYRIACGRDFTVVYTQSTNNLYYFGAQKKCVINLPCGLEDAMLECGKDFMLVYKTHIDAQDENMFGCLPLTLDMVMCMMRKQEEDCHQEIKNVLARALSRASCFSGSFLYKNAGTNFSKSCHNIDLDAAVEFFNEVKTPTYHETVEQSLKTLLKSLSHETIKSDTLRMFLLLPCCLYEEKSPKYCDNIAISLVYLIGGLQKCQKEILAKWLKSISTHYFKRYVLFFRRCVKGQLKKLLQVEGFDPFDLDNISPSVELGIRIVDTVIKVDNIISPLEPCVKVLDRLHEINEHRCTPIPYHNFCIGNLVDVISSKYLFSQLQFPFNKFPFLYNLAARDALLKRHCNELMQRNNLVSYFGLVLQQTAQLKVRRNHLLEDTRERILQNEKHLRKRFDVMFEGENEESGNGIRQEFFRLLAEALMDEKFGAFYYENQAVLQWFTVKGDHESSNLDDIRFIGFICGLALYNGVTLPLNFPSALYKKLLDKPVSYEDLLGLKPIPYRICKDVYEYPDDDIGDAMLLDFGMPVELCPNGANITVNSSNKLNYVEKLADYYLNKEVEKEFESFREGFYTAMPREFVVSYQPKELQEILTGNEDYDFKALEKNVEYGYDYHRGHETIEMFWKVFHELELQDQKRFLRFLTGTDRIPAFGMQRYLIQIYPKECEDPDWRLPHAETCTNTLFLPRYTNPEDLEFKLLMAVSCDTGFGLP